jgi:hypothetical protein
MNRKKIILSTPLFIVVVIAVYNLILVFRSNMIFDNKLIFAFIILVITCIVYFVKFEYYIYLMLLMLFLASLNIISFYPERSISSYFISIAGVRLSTPSIEGSFFIIFIMYAISIYLFLFKKK